MVSNSQMEKRSARPCIILFRDDEIRLLKREPEVPPLTFFSFSIIFETIANMENIHPRMRAERLPTVRGWEGHAPCTHIIIDMELV